MLLLPLAAASLTAATCNKDQGGASSDTPKAASSASPMTAASPGPSASPTPTAGAPAAGSPSPAAGSPSPAAGGEDRAKAALSGVPGMDFSSLPPSAQKELANVFSDSFCYCGCPHTLGACLKTHTSCRHAKRMALLAASEAAAGAAGYEITTMLEKYYQSFREPRSSTKVDERLCKGPKDAKVTVVEFADFECPYCRAASPMLDKLVAGGKARLCYAPFPLAQHPNAIPAGQAALFARDKGKFWEMHDQLFEHQTELNPAFIKQLAQQVGLNPNELQKVFDDKKYVDELNAWRDAGKAANVDATPSIYFNGRKFNLPVSPETLSHTLDDELEWIANKNAWAAD